VSTGRRHILLINPPIAKRRHARFPLGVLNLSASLDGHYRSSIIDGNIDSDYIASTLGAIESRCVDAVGVGVMGGPQLRTAIDVCDAIRNRYPALPIIWGGHFPTICAGPALNSPYTDFAIRGQGEQTLRELLDAMFDGGDGAPAVSHSALAGIAGLSWRQGERVVHNPNRPFSADGAARPLPYERVGDPRPYLSPTYLGRRTSGYQAAIGCRFRCTFCGVAAMFRGKTAMPAAERLEQHLRYLMKEFGVDSLIFYDHNFFDREEDTIPVLEVLARVQLPWWCFARADALLKLSSRAWELIHRSRLRMAYIGAESPSDWLLHEVRKGTHTNQTLEAVEICRRNGVTPELSFMLAPPHDPEGETERTFDFIREVKRQHPATEIMLYIYAPLPPAPGASSPHVERSIAALKNADGSALQFPATAQGWAEPDWINYWCHTDVPWLTPRLRQRIRDFSTVLSCRFPTATDIRSPQWGKTALRTLAGWRYELKRYGRPWELDLSKRFIRLWDPRLSGL
jgi:anaerobic magnesium-protoporphyrin IX monomethyl ester cyclase